MPDPLQRRGKRIRAVEVFALCGLVACGVSPLASQPLHWGAIGPPGGGVESLAPVAVSPGTVWAGVAGVGVWKSVDGGASWVRTSLQAQGLTIAVVADPADPLVVYARTGGGVVKSSDGGASWSLIHAVAQLGSLALAPSAPLVLYQAERDQLGDPTVMSRSDDGGATWRAIAPIPSSTIDALAVDTADPDTVYAAGSAFHVDSTPAVWRSTDGGATWTSSILPGYFSALLIDPRNPATLYGALFDRLARSRDRGATWETIAGPPGGVQATSLALDPRSGALYAGLISSYSPRLVGQIWRSLDAGASWTLAIESAGQEILALATDAGLPGRVYAGTDVAGVLRSGDAGTHWQVSNSGLMANQVQDVKVDSRGGGALYAALCGIGQSCGVAKSTDGGATWASIDRGLTDSGELTLVSTLAIEPQNAGVLYAGGLGGVFKSDDGGQSWHNSGAGLQLVVADLLVNPVQPKVLFAAGTSYRQTLGSAVARSLDGGATWAPLLTLPGAVAGCCASFATLTSDPSAPAAVFVGGQGGLWETLDAGGTWTPRGANLPQGQAIIRLRFDGAHHLYALLEVGPLLGVAGGTRDSSQVAGNVGSAGHSLYRSADSGVTFTAFDTGLPAGAAVRDLLADPRGTALYAATDTGVYVSRDGAASWTGQNDGLSETRVTRLAADPSRPGVLYAGTVADLFVSPPLAGSCVPGDAVLCLAGGRFKAQVAWKLADGSAGSGHAVALAGDTGSFWFFGPESTELFVKIVDGSALNGHFWLFYGALSDVAYSLTVTDTVTGAQRTYVNPAGRLASLADTSAFASASIGPAPPVPLPEGEKAAPHRTGGEGWAWAPPWGSGAARSPAAAGSACAPASNVLCLEESRFAVQITWRLPGLAATSALAVPLSRDTGAFWFFGPESLEVAVKVIDGRLVNGHFWVFLAALSNVAYTVTVTDTGTGASKEFVNPPGELASRADTAAF